MGAAPDWSGVVDDFAAQHGAALVLGASGGLGSAIASMLADRGSDVALTYRRQPESVCGLIEAARSAGRRARAWRLDLTDASETQAVADEAAETFGGLHTVVYAAGPHVPMSYLSATDPAAFRDQLYGDAGAFFNAAHAAVGHLRQTAGSLVAITTAATARYPVRDGLSAGPKGAVESLVKGIAAEEGKYGVRANCVGPGMLSEGMADTLIASGDLDERALTATRANIPLRRFGTARDIAEATCFLASPRAAFISGQKLDVDGGYTA